MSMLFNRLMAGAPAQMRGIVPQARPGGPASAALMSRGGAMPAAATAAPVTMAADVDVDTLGHGGAFGGPASAEQVRQNRTALVANALDNLWGEPGNGRWGFNISPQARQAWQEAGIIDPGPNEGGPDSDSDIYSAITRAYRRNLIDPQGVQSTITAAGGPQAGVGGGTNAIGAPNFSGMTLGDAMRSAVYGTNDPVTGRFMGGFRQLSEVPLGSWGWARTLFGGGGISNAGDPGGLPDNGHGAGNPGR